MQLVDFKDHENDCHNNANDIAVLHQNNLASILEHLDFNEIRETLNQEWANEKGYP